MLKEKTKSLLKKLGDARLQRRIRRFEQRRAQAIKQNKWAMILSTGEPKGGLHL